MNNFKVNSIFAEAWAKATDNAKPITVENNKTVAEAVILLSRDMIKYTKLSAEERNEVIRALFIPDVNPNLVQRIKQEIEKV